MKKALFRLVFFTIFLTILYVGALAVAHNYAIWKAGQIESGDTYEEVQDTKGLLISKTISISDIRDAYIDADGRLANTDGTEILVYYTIMGVGFIVVFDGSDNGVLYIVDYDI